MNNTQEKYTALNTFPKKVTEEYSDSIRMLVLLESGEQILATFILPNENCTVQDILEQIGVNYHPDTIISCTELKEPDLDYLITVGEIDPSDMLQLHGIRIEEDSSQVSNHKTEVEQVSSIIEGTSESVGETFGNVNNLNVMLNANQPLNNIKGSINSKSMTPLLNKVPNRASLTARKKKPKIVEPDPVVLTLSSEDEDESAENTSETQNMQSKNSPTLCNTITKEPTIGVPNSEMGKILIYPPGQGGMSINTGDYVCLGKNQYLNDVIIDFYLKYLVLNLPPEQQKKVHVFSTFFYTRLTAEPIKPRGKTHPTEVDSNLTKSQKCHARVKKWTKNVNLFEKDFIVVPINQNSHWFLAIICFPGMDNCCTMNGKPHVVKKPNKLTKKDIPSRLGSQITLSPFKESDKDEADGKENELDSGENSKESDIPYTAAAKVTKKTPRPPTKRPCILIFDSLNFSSRVQVVSTLRGYLTCEYKAKMGVDKFFDWKTIVGNYPKVPQQTNYTDCGLYVLQYVEQFFKDPIKDYRKPIKHLENWFEEITVTKKREDISVLIKQLMISQNRDPGLLPDIMLPTSNGELVDHLPKKEFIDERENKEDKEGAEENASFDSFSDSLNVSTACDLQLESDLETNPKSALLINRSHHQMKFNLDQNLTLTESKSSKDNSTTSFSGSPSKSVLNTPSDIPQQSNKDILMYLKKKRAIKHKGSSQGDPKRFKQSAD